MSSQSVGGTGNSAKQQALEEWALDSLKLKRLFEDELKDVFGEETAPANAVPPVTGNASSGALTEEKESAPEET